MTNSPTKNQFTSPARDKYHRRRTINPSEQNRIQIIDIEPNTTEQTRFEKRWKSVVNDETKKESTGQNPTRFADIYFGIAGEVWKATVDATALSAIAKEAPVSVQFFSITELIGTDISVTFTQDMEKILVNNTTIPINFCSDTTLSKVRSRTTNTDDLSHIERDISLCHVYNRHSPEWTCSVESVTEIDDSTLAITANTGTQHSITWEIELPKTTDKNANPKARLIENVGQGDPFFIENENIIIIHKKHADRHLPTVAKDETNTWLLTTPTDYTKWKNSNSNNKTTKKTQDTNPRTRRKVRDIKQKMIVYHIGFLLSFPLIDSFANLRESLFVMNAIRIGLLITLLGFLSTYLLQLYLRDNTLTRVN